MQFKHVIWDFDGTLFDSYPAMALSFCKALQTRGIVKQPEEIMPFLKISMGHAIEHFQKLFGLDEAFFYYYRQLQKQTEIDHAKPYADIPQLCSGIFNHGGSNYIVTHRGESVLSLLDGFNLTPLFAEIITSKNSFARKPSPEAILFLMEKYNFKPEQAIMLGDRELDILAGKNAGAKTCYFSENGSVCDAADITINDFKELYAVLGLPHTE